MRPTCLSNFLNNCSFSPSDNALYFSNPLSDSFSFSSDRATSLTDDDTSRAVHRTAAIVRTFWRVLRAEEFEELIVVLRRCKGNCGKEQIFELGC